MSDHSALLLNNALQNIATSLQLLQSLKLLTPADAHAITDRLPRADALSTQGPTTIHSPHGSRIDLREQLDGGTRTNSPYPPAQYGSAYNAGGGGEAGGAFRPPPPLPNRGGPPRQEARATWDYTGQAAEDLSFRAQDVIVVVEETNNEWWRGHLAADPSQHIGLFPSAYVQKLPPSSSSPMVNEKAIGVNPVPYNQQIHPFQHQTQPMPMQQWPPPPPQQQPYYVQQVAPPPSPAQQAVIQAPPQQQQQKPGRFDGFGKVLATSAVGGVGFGAGSAVGSGIINAIF